MGALTSVLIVVMVVMQVGAVEALMVAMTVVMMPLITRVITGFVIITPARGALTRVLGKTRGQLLVVKVMVTWRVSSTPLC